MNRYLSFGRWSPAPALGVLAALAWASPCFADSAHDSVGAFLILSPVVLALIGLGGLVTGYFMYRIFR